ncbi:uncharacterized protein J8A68_002005 [[Candida] subhashii]|uniref:Nucleolar 27S pre-rRNA processing Urb2/Npa2 C-terminal domain-containing protein n=1 Tax=[Candida] subhashii TaxID=561895 RepID=A0A8J5QMY1_9ASCO|nr:uncharacterized protein J8A68_002005 [[Candida] subhashii]KAG7664449.1 hypothetical protein J8A68_002005 [[Candida] subhashii]
MIRHLLEMPTFQSELETDFDKLIKVMELSGAGEIGEIVWNNHLRMIKDGEKNLSYVKDGITRLIKSLKKKKNGKKNGGVTGEMRLTVIILSNGAAEVEEVKGDVKQLKGVFIERCVQGIDGADREWYINSIMKVLQNNDQQTEDDYSSIIIKKLKNQDSGLSTDLVFPIYANIIPIDDLKKGIYIITLFMTSHQLLRNNPNDIDAAAALSRLITNLCEPAERGGSNKNNEEGALTTMTNIHKKGLRKHVGVLLSNYISLVLTHGFTKLVNDELLVGVYSIFGLLSSVELKVVSQGLDMSGRTLFRSIYNDYKDYGKWKDQ